MFRRIRDSTVFTIDPRRTRDTEKILRDFESEGLIRITECGRYDGELWRVERL
jgi:hypothetical protein